MTLEEYERKRPLELAPEPRYERRAAPVGHRFVIQKHDASQLHYDLRLEVNGALKSWSLPKGLAAPHDPKKLAVNVEDHPLEYLTFAGVIPPGRYGAGKVEIWDQGRFAAKDPAQNLQKGHLSFQLQGEKVNGWFSLVRMKGHDWLIILRRPGRLNPDLRVVGEAAEMPTAIAPMKATLVEQPFDSPDFAFEIKFDGIRALTYIGADGGYSIKSRNQLEQSFRYPELTELPGMFLASELIVDGEIVALDSQGVSRFQLLQERLNLNEEPQIARASKKVPAYYFIFDLLYLDGRSLRGLPWQERRAILSRIFMPRRRVKLSESIEGGGVAMLAAAREQGLEGIIAKRRQSPYRTQRSRDWQKIKIVAEQEFVIVGFTEPRGSRSRFGSLLLGIYQQGRLRYAGACGSGFSERSLGELYRLMQPLEQESPSVTTAPDLGEAAHWIKPQLVAQVKFSEWTKDGLLRQPVFLGLRDDLDPREAVRELPERASAAAPDRTPAAPVSVMPPLPPLEGEKQTILLAGKELTLSHLDKLFWPDEGYRKFDLINYYFRVAPLLLPHLQGRPLTLKRYPHGYGSRPFFQKEAAPETPDWVHQEPIDSESSGGAINFIVCDDLPSLIYLANLACISQNAWLSSLPHLDKPDFLVFDLDPSPPAGFAECLATALMIKDILNSFGLQGYAKTSGASGLHVYVPLLPQYSFAQSRQFAEVVALLCREERPELVTLATSLAQRDGKVYIDYLQNVRGKTMATVYSVRAEAGAPVSTPLEWSEVKSGVKPGDFTIKNAPDRFAARGDLFTETLSNKQDLLAALKAGARYLSG